MPDERQGITKFLEKNGLSRDLLVKITIGALVILILALLFPRGESIELDYKVGAVWAQNDLIAPFSYPIFRDEREYVQDVDAAKKNVYDVFERDSLETVGEFQTLETFFHDLDEVAALYNNFRRSARRRLPSVYNDSLAFSKANAQLNIPFSAAEWETIGAIAASGRLADMRQALLSIMEEFTTTGIIDRNKNTLRPEIALRRGKTEEIVPVGRFHDQTEIVTLLEKRLLTHYRPGDSALSIAYKIGIMHIVPNVKFNPGATEQAVAGAVDAVPRTSGFVQENERIVSKHERITPDIKLKLESLRRSKAERGPESDTATQFLGTLLHVAIVVMLYGIYLFYFRKKIFANNRRLALIGLLLLMEGAFSYITRELNVHAPVEYLIFVPAASMLLTVIFDSRVGFYGTVIVAYLVAGIKGNDYSIALASLVAGALAVYTVRDIRNRTQIFRSLGFIFLGYGLSIIALGLERFETMPKMGEQLAFALVNAVVSPVLTYGFLIFIERVFRVTTDLTLLELAHFNHPLLRMLAEQAPGTYHHSITMATLAEAAASAVGANEVLARVGAYFHDIGKIVKPGYFIENQKSSRNRHDKLSPRMSSLIIAAHVKEGIAVAREHNLPDEVIDFIPMHHGTTRMDFFYNKALEVAKKDPDETRIDEIKEADYRYPGPKPQTKETGIMMLADAIEATVRTIEEPTPQRLEAAIDDLIKKRFEEGELDECPLTLKDLTKIKAAFLNVLVGIHHTRVKYPELPKKKPRKAGPEQTEPTAPTPPDADSSARLSQTIREIDKQ